MPKPFTTWTVLPHGKLNVIDDDILSVTGDLHMPLGDYTRRMTVVRLGDGRLVIYSAISLHEDEMQQLESFGEPSFLVVPGTLHRLDAKTWKDRYPNVVVVAPEGAQKKVEEVVKVDRTGVDFADPRVHLVNVAGMDEHELALEIDSNGTTVVVNDILWNVANRPGLGGFVMRLLGFTGEEPKIPSLIARRSVTNEGALRAQLEAWARLPNLRRIIVSHGNIIEDDPAGALLRIANDLTSSQPFPQIVL